MNEVLKPRIDELERLLARRDRATGSFILIDDATHHTVAAGMIEG